MDDGSAAMSVRGEGNTEPLSFAKVGRVRVQARYMHLLQQSGLTGFSSVFAFDGGEQLDKPGLAPWRERRRVVFHDSNGDPHTFYLKRYIRPPFGCQVRRLAAGGLRTSTAGREWQTITDLARAGIPVPEPVAFGQEVRRGFERRSFLVVAEVPGESLERWLPEHWQRAATGTARRRQREILVRLARGVAAFHAAGFVHRDLYTSHIFLRWAEGETSPSFTFIDLQRVFRPWWRRSRWVVKDLAALHFSTRTFASRADRLRFWKEYLRGIGRPRWAEALPPRVAAKSERMRRHFERRAAGEGRTS